MSVNIQVSADPSSVLSSFNQIQDAIARAGQAGKKFGDIDLSHKELAPFAADLQRVQRQLEELGRLGRGATAAGVKSIMGDTPDLSKLGGFETGATARYPDRRDLERFIVQAGAYILRDTSFAALPGFVPGGVGTAPPLSQNPEAQPLTATGRPPPTPRDGRAPTSSSAATHKRGSDSILWNTLKAGAGFALGEMGIGLSVEGAMGLAKRALHGAEQEDRGNETLFRQFRDGAADFATLRDSVRKAADGMGITYQEGQRLALAYAKRAGDIDRFAPGSTGVGLGLAGHVRETVGFARSTGTDASQTNDVFARLDRLGMSFNHAATTITDTMRAGHMGGQTEEVMQAILRWTELSAKQMTDGGPHTGAFASMYAAMNASGNPGLMGQNAEAIIGRINQSVTSGGGRGMASQLLDYRALRSVGITNPYQIQYLQEGGMFEPVKGKDGKTHLLGELERDEIAREYHGQDPLRTLSAQAGHFGITMHQFQGTQFLLKADTSASRKYLKDHGITDVNPTAYPDISRVLGKNADLDAERKAMLARTVLSPAEIDKMSKDSGAALREDLVRAMAAHGMKQTEGSRLAVASAGLANSLTKMGTPLVDAMTGLKGVTAKLGDTMAEVESLLKRFLTTPSKGMQWFPSGGSGQGGATAPDGQSLLNPSNPVNGYTPVSFEMLRSAGSAPQMFGGLSAPALTSPEQKKRAAEAMAYFQAHGWTKNQAAGIVSSLQRESGFNAGAVGDHGRAYGALQWHGDRQAAFQRWSGHSIHGSSYEEQLAFIQWELTHSEKAAGDALRRAHGAYQSGAIVSERYVRPRDVLGEAERRGLGARAFRDMGHGPASVPVPHITQAGYGVRHRFEVAPLRVIHEGADGRHRGEETLPVRQVGPPQPWGQMT